MEILERIWETLGAIFGGVLRGFERSVTKLFGSSNARYVKLLQAKVDAIKALEGKYSAMTEEELRAQTSLFRERLKKGETLDDIQVEAFAVCREGGRRFLGMRHYDVQMMGGMVLHKGSIAEMVTGEGKTLVATLPTYLNALEGKGVHVITVNDYLARRDMEWMGPLYMGLGLTVGAIQSNMDVAARQKAYACDITYGTNNEFGFDYLRDNMRPAARGDDNFPKHLQQSQGPLNYAVIDEVDNILVDEARTPLIISGPAHQDVGRYAEADKIARQLKQDEHFEVREKEHTVILSDDGVREAEKLAGVESFYTTGNMEWPHLIDNALKAHHLYKRDVNYIVKGDEVIIVDEFTGRQMPGRQWSDGLHQAVEAKEKVRIKEETQTLATITLQNFFKLYKKISGMTGTAMTEANEFWKIYKLDVVAIPTNRGLQRIVYPDVVYGTEKAKWNAICEDIERIHKWDVVECKGQQEVVGTLVKEDDKTIEIQPKGSKDKEIIPREKVLHISRKGRPVLVGTVSIEKSELISKLLERRGVTHQVLNAKNHEREAEIIAQAGRKAAVTIATNMAGRGTDIVLGGNPETMAWAQLQSKYPTRLDVPPAEWEALVAEIESREHMKPEGRDVASMGGLHVVGSERHEARRIDLQLIGRCGRQGDPGSSRFYLSLEDDLMRIFGGDWVKKALTMLGMHEDEAIESGLVSRRIEAAQKKVEERNFEIRKHLLEYDEVMDEQRKRVYGYRQRILNGGSCRDLVLQMVDDQIKGIVNLCLDKKYGAEAFASYASAQMHTKFEARDFRDSDFAEAERIAHEEAVRMSETAVLDAIEENLPEDADPSEWQWEGLTKWVNTRYGLNMRDRDLKAIDRNDMSTVLIEKAEAAMQKVDLSGGKHYLDPDYGLNSIIEWVERKLVQKLTVEELRGLDNTRMIELLKQKAREAYTRREAEFPVSCGLVWFSQPEGKTQRLDRDRFIQWASDRFEAEIPAEEVKEKQRPELRELLVGYSRKHLANADPKLQAVAKKVDELFANTSDDTQTLAWVSGGNGALESVAKWTKEELLVELPPEELGQLNRTQLSNRLRFYVEKRYTSEIRRIERSLLLEMLDTAWKDHLLAMDHLRSAVGMRGYAQVDPKVEFKREGMKLFEGMWEGIADKVTDLVFKLEAQAQPDEVQESNTWAEAEARHDSAPAPVAQTEIGEQQEAAIANSQASADTKHEPIRNRQEIPERNEKCWCGSGKKFKHCCLPRIRSGQSPLWLDKAAQRK